MILKNPKLIAGLLFLLYLGVGLSIYKDYGIPWDEAWGRENGIVNAIYMAEKLNPGMLEGKNYCQGCDKLKDYSDADHGPFFELIPTFLEYVLEIKDLQHVFQLRHLCIFLMHCVGVFFFYLLLQMRFKRVWISLAGALMLVASPRMFADAFFNAKDIPFLALTLISCYTLFRFLEKKNLKNAMWHGLACGLALDIRILGLLMPIITIIATGLAFKPKREGGEPLIKIVISLVVFLLVFGGITIAFWPHLWEKPFLKIAGVLARSGTYPWNHEVLFNGTFYLASELPWYYLPVWIFISTPVLYILLFFTGFGGILITAFKNGFRVLRMFSNLQIRQDLLMLGMFLVPFSAAIILKLVLFDSWRHLYFMYGPFLYISMVGLVKVYDYAASRSKNSGIFRKAVIYVWFIWVGGIVFWMIRNHPHQNVYFSVNKGPALREQFEMDYWGLSYKQGLAYILNHDNRDTVRVFVANAPGMYNQFSLEPSLRNRLHYDTTVITSDYFLTEYRWHPEPYTPTELKVDHLKEVYSIKVDGMTILSVFKVK